MRNDWEAGLNINSEQLIAFTFLEGTVLITNNAHEMNELFQRKRMKYNESENQDSTPKASLQKVGWT